MTKVYTASAYFLGYYRPLYVTGETPTQALARLAERIEGGPSELRDRFKSVWDMTTLNGWNACTATSSEHGKYGVSWREGLPWDMLAEVTSDMPACPNIKY